MARVSAADVDALEKVLSGIKTMQNQQLTVSAQMAEQAKLREKLDDCEFIPGIRVDYIAEVGRNESGRYMVLRRSEADKACSGAGSNYETIIAGPGGGGRHNLSDDQYGMIAPYVAPGYLRSGVSVALFSGRLLHVDQAWRGLDFKTIGPPFVPGIGKKPGMTPRPMDAAAIMRENELLAHKRLKRAALKNARDAALHDNGRQLDEMYIVPAFLKHACLMHIGDDFSYNRIVMGILTDGEVFFDGDIAGIMTNEAGVCILNFGMDMSKTRMLGDLIDKYRSRMLSKSGKKPIYVLRTDEPDPAAEREAYEEAVRAAEAAKSSRANDPRLAKYEQFLK